MRLASVLLLLALAAPALAQDPIPDTTAAWRYFPLEVGNQWEYRDYSSNPAPYQRNLVVEDTLIGGQRYFLYRREWYRGDFSLYFAAESFLRFDTTEAKVVMPDGSAFYPCRLDTPFPGFEPIECENDNIVAGIGPEEEVSIGSSVVTTAVKAFDSVLGGPMLAAGIGYIGPYVCEGGCDVRIHYARVGGVEYGEPVILLASEPLAEPAALGLAAHPNPFASTVSLDLAAAVPQTLRVEVLDVLGRLVHAEARAVSATSRIRLDGARWALGVYVVLVTAEDGARATARLIRR